MTKNMDFEKKLSEAFKLMRSAGLYARQNYQCCMSCGLAAAHAEVKKHPSWYWGICFYHKQDAEHMRRGDSCYLRYAPTRMESAAPSAKHLAMVICLCLTAADLEYEWTGDVSTAIRVLRTD